MITVNLQGPATPYIRYLHIHGLLHDDKFVLHLNDKGEKVYNFQYIVR